MFTRGNTKNRILTLKIARAMQKIHIGMTIIVIFLLLLVFSCSKDDNGSRTRDKEWEELDAVIKELEADSLDIDTTALSVFYITRNPGIGPFPKEGDTCSVSYYGFYLPQGIQFENSRDIHPPDGKWIFIYKPHHKVAGLVDAIGYMNAGSQIEMYIHSDFAYGKEGTSVIPPYTTLFYRATMHEIRPKKK